MKKSGITWTDYGESIDTKRQIADAYLAPLLRGRNYSKQERILLHRFALTVQELVPLFAKDKEIVRSLQDMLQTVSSSRPQRSNISFYGKYRISYSAKLKGPKTMSVTENSLKKLPPNMRVTKGIKRIGGKSLSLLVGELSQYLIRPLLRRIRIHQKTVISVKSFRPYQKKGKRVDDWILVMRNKTMIPVEVKASAKISYFKRAFAQLKNALKKYEHALFVGIKFDLTNLPNKNIGIILINRGESKKDFIKKIHQVFSS